MASSLQIVPATRTARVTRRPQHPFYVSTTAFSICPVFIAPVLPGETMKNLLFQARVVSDPVANALIGWWCEFYFFYVKHRDLNERDTLTQMMIDPSVTAPITPTAKPQHFHHTNGVNYVEMCLRRVTEMYFRETGEAWDSSMGQSGTLPKAQISQMSALDSACLDSVYTAGAPGLVVGADDTITGQEIDQTWILWQQYRAANITKLSYEEYLATYGIPLPQGADSEHRPELVRYVKDWTYPSNTINPADGAPSSALSWAIAERADKDRFFREPGFLFGVTVIRPKVYLGGQSGSITGDLKDALSWLPAVMGDNPEYSVRKFTANTGPYNVVTSDYRVDLKDLFLYGEHYTNLTNVPMKVSLPSPSIGKRYPSDTDIAAFFKGAGVSIRIDGIVSLNVLGQQIETTPTRAPGTF